MEHNAQQAQKENIMEHNMQQPKASTSRRSFLRKGLVIGGAGTIGAGLLAGGLSLPAFAAEESGDLTQGDVAILRAAQPGESPGAPAMRITNFITSEEFHEGGYLFYYSL